MNISKPTIIIDKKKCMANLERMTAKANAGKTKFRPHFKTHQSAFIGNWFRKQGIHAITVSSVSMARYFSDYGWKDITISTPVNTLESQEINELAKSVVLNIIAESPEPLQHLETYLVYKVGVFIEIDTGDHRSGLDWNDLKDIDELLAFLSTAKKLEFKGFLTHSGHTYHAENQDEIRGIYLDTVRKMKILKERYLEKWPDLILSVGDTPACSIVEDFSEVDEIRPGNFIFYDLIQYSIGSCTIEDISIAVACPVIAINPKRNEIVIYGGAVHLSKEFLYKSSGERIYGYVVKFLEGRWSQPIIGAYVTNITQEHGIIKASPDIIEQTKRGDILGILPVHSCLTANMMKSYLSLDDESIGY